eukprot:m.6191 g.6191  ORF g.6191 m.6191 type:complete len:54 (+) comp4716_c0_seq1:1375-1536(+)
MPGLWERYKAIPSRKRLFLGLTGVVCSLVGMHFSEQLEQQAKAAQVSPSDSKE